MLVCLLIVLILNPIQVEPLFNIGSIFDVVEFAYDIVSKINEIDDIVWKFQEEDDKIEKTLDKMTSMIDDVSASIEAMERKVSKELEDIKIVVSGLRLGNQIDAAIDKLSTNMIKIDGFYDDFQEYSANLSTWNRITLQDFAAGATASSGGLVEALRQIHGLIVPTKGIKKNLITLLSEEIKNNAEHSCDEEQMPQQRLFDLYSSITVTEIKAYVTISFSYIVQETLGNGRFISEVKSREKQFELRVEQYGRLFLDAMSRMPRTSRRCDPPKYKRGENFYEFERFINAYVIQQDAIKGHNGEEGCIPSCEAMDKVLERNAYTKCSGIECKETPQTCHGKIVGCTWGGNMEICPAKANSPRRYEWYTWKDTVYGDKGDCKEPMLHPSQYDSKTSGYYCYVCRCICFDDSPLSNSMHFVSVREVLADTDNNMVVTGIKFVLKNKILQLQIQQGRLAQIGMIEEDSENWKDPEDISLRDQRSCKGWTSCFHIKKGDEYTALENGHVALLSYEERSFNLDELTAPNDHVITGVRLSRVPGDGDNKGPIQLEILVHPFDFDSGELKDNASWMNADTIEQNGQRSEIKHVEENKNPLESLRTELRSEKKAWVRLSRGGWVATAGQMVIPLLDGLGAHSSPPMPLSAIRLLHKAEKDHAGFLSWEITTIDLSKAIKPDNPGREKCTKRRGCN